MLRVIAERRKRLRLETAPCDSRIERAAPSTRATAQATRDGEPPLQPVSIPTRTMPKSPRMKITVLTADRPQMPHQVHRIHRAASQGTLAPARIDPARHDA
jgi:hypothetical protein